MALNSPKTRKSVTVYIKSVSLLLPQIKSDPNSIVESTQAMRHAFIPIQQETNHLEDHCLVGKLVDHPVPIDPDLIREAILSGCLPPPEGDMEVQPLPNGWHLLKFSKSSDTERVLYSEPYHVEGHLLALYEWTEGFCPYETEPTKVDLWARIPGLPLQLFASEALGSLLMEAGVGFLIRIDEAANAQNHMKFARVCLNVDLTRPLRRRVPYLDGEFRVWYEDYSPGCGCCGRDGHVFDACPLNTNPPTRVHVVLEPDHADADVGHADEIAVDGDDVGDAVSAVHSF